MIGLLIAAAFAVFCWAKAGRIRGEEKGLIDMSHNRQVYQDLVKSDAVHGSVYLDTEIFDDEMKKIYGVGWVYIGHESEVPNPGDFKRKKLGKAPVIFSRDQQGKTHVLFNRCRHRASTVCQLDEGNAKHFRCEYHGWMYGLDGELRVAPYPDAYTNLDRAKLSLNQPARVEQYRGFVFASLKDTGLSLFDYLGGPTREQLDIFCDASPEGEIDVRAGVTKFVYDGNWKLQMENSIDGYHPNFTHQSFFDGFGRRGESRPPFFDGDSDCKSRALGRGNGLLDYRPMFLAPKVKEVLLGQLKQTSWGRKYYDDMVAAHGQARAEDVICGRTHMNVFPNLMVLGEQVRTLRPISATRTEVELAPTLLKGAPDEINEMRLRSYEAFYTTQGGGIHDDIEMFNRVADGLRCEAEPWLLFNRGVDRELEEDGTISGHITDEIPQRAMWRYWLEVMTAND